MLKNLLIFLFLFTSILLICYFGWGPRPLKPVLMHHQAPVISYKNMYVNFFELEILLLKFKGFSFYSMKNYIGAPVNRSVFLTFDDGTRDFYTYIYPVLKRQKVSATLYVPVNHIDTPGYVTTQQLREMLDSGYVELGSHGIAHVPLINVSVPIADAEITGSRMRLESLFDTQVTSFAYPYGYVSKELMDRVVVSGYFTAVLDEKKSDVIGNSQFLINRYPISLSVLIGL